MTALQQTASNFTNTTIFYKSQYQENYIRKIKAIISALHYLMALETVFVLGFNALLIYGLYKTNRPLATINKLFIYLSCTDSLAMIFGVLLHLSYYNKSDLLRQNHQTLSYILNVLAYVGITTFATISTLRFCR